MEARYMKFKNRPLSSCDFGPTPEDVLANAKRIGRGTPLHVILRQQADDRADAWQAGMRLAGLAAERHTQDYWL